MNNVEKIPKKSYHNRKMFDFYNFKKGLGNCMDNKKMISQYMQFNKLLLSTLNVNKKSVDVFDGYGIKNFSYRGFFEYLASFFNLIPDFIDKAIIALESVNPENEMLEIESEYKTKNGEPANFVYNFIKQSQTEFLLSIRKLDTKDEAYLDQMTKANPKSYIDNMAMTNKLTKTPYLLMYVDIDNFKHINDEYGQLVGDMILIEMVSVAKSILGIKGAISRIGGDRFLVIYEIEDDYDYVHDFIFNFKQSMQHISASDSRGISITVTIGSARFPSDGDYELLLKKCMKALIRGKNKGRDCFIMYLEEKCGKVTLDDEITDKVVKNDDKSTKNDVYSLISNINQALSTDKDFDEAVDRTISLVGNYFYIDRVSVARLDIKTHTIMKHHTYYNPKISDFYKVYCVNEVMPLWAKALGVKNYINIDNTKSLPDDYPLKKAFEVDHTMASMSFELVVNNVSFGLIRLDMTTGVRHWQPEDLQVFMLISQLFASFLQKNYLREKNYKTFYTDPVYNCNNFTKMFSDAGDLIITGTIKKYTIIEMDIRNIISYKSIIGKKKMVEFVHCIIDILEKAKDIIYGKYHDGPFVIFINGDDKFKVEKLLTEVSNSINKFSRENGIHEFSIQAGVYFADSRVDTLTDSLSNANLTRIINKNEMVLYYSDDVKKASLFKNEMILRVDEAIENDEFLLYLQPKISTTTGKLIGAEALTRWNYKNEKLLFPDQFIPVFEEQGVIEKLDFSVFENVCKYQRMLIDKSLSPVPISVNVSRYVANFNAYIDTIEKIRNKYNIDSKLIEIEITEGMFYENSFIISEFINKLHKIGYKVSMDDFGAGYSNLVSMAKLNFDIIKFDRSFCLDLDNSNVKIMLNKLIELIKTLRMHTICEGVETKENVEYLTKIGCDSIQGYFYSKPIPWKDFINKYYN